MACSSMVFLAVFVAAAAAAAGSCLPVAAAGEPLPPAGTPLSFREGYTQLFGDSNLALHGDGRRVHISLDERTGLAACCSFPIDRPPLFYFCSSTSSPLLCFPPRRRRVRVAGRVPPRALQRPHQAPRRPHRRRRRRLLREHPSTHPQGLWRRGGAPPWPV